MPGAPQPSASSEGQAAPADSMVRERMPWVGWHDLRRALALTWATHRPDPPALALLALPGRGAAAAWWVTSGSRRRGAIRHAKAPERSARLPWSALEAFSGERDQCMHARMNLEMKDTRCVSSRRRLAGR